MKKKISGVFFYLGVESWFLGGGGVAVGTLFGGSNSVVM